MTIRKEVIEMIRKREYIDRSINEKQLKDLKRGKVVIIGLPDGKMMSLAMRNNLMWRRYVRAKSEYMKFKHLLKKR